MIAAQSGSQASRAAGEPRVIRTVLLLALAAGLAVLAPTGYMKATRAGGVLFNLDAELGKARQVTRGFTNDLKLELSRALRSGGPAAAVGAYHAAAPEIAARHSAASGFQVRRTALKLRNKQNQPTDWERQVLEYFVAMQKSGIDARKLEHYDLIATRAGERLFRYMKAIPASQSCQDCHGTDVAREITSEIAKYYEDDKSKGFKTDEIIGAYTLIKIVE